MQIFPLVTVCSLCYNNANYVIQALESVLKQEYSNIEFLVIEDFSTDNSIQLLESWFSSCSVPYRLIKHKTNKGLHFGFNETIDLANGKYIGWVGDDLWVEGKLKKQVEVLESLGEEFALTYGDTSNINEFNQVTVPSRFKLYSGENYTICQGSVFNDVVSGFGIMVQSCLFRTDAVRKSSFRADKRIISEDVDILLYLSKSYKFHGTKEVMSLYRTFENSASTSSYYWKDENKHLVYLSNFRMFKKHLLKLNFFSLDKKVWFLLLNKIFDNGQNYMIHPNASLVNKGRVFLTIFFLKVLDKVFR